MTSSQHSLPMPRRYHPRGAALQLWEGRWDEVLLSGPAGTGKSRACLEKGYAIAWLYPGSRGLIVRKTRRSITQSTMVTFAEKVLPGNSQVYFHTADGDSSGDTLDCYETISNNRPLTISSHDINGWNTI